MEEKYNDDYKYIEKTGRSGNIWGLKETQEEVSQVFVISYSS